MALVLGIVGLASILVVCGLGLVVSPLAWYYGNSALNEIKLSNGSLGGYDSARAGQVMGIIGTVLLATILLGFVILILAVAA
jgi:hypothetical protein